MNQNYVLGGVFIAAAAFMVLRSGPVADTASVEDAASRAKSTLAAHLGTAATRAEADRAEPAAAPAAPDAAPNRAAAVQPIDQTAAQAKLVEQARPGGQAKPAEPANPGGPASTAEQAKSMAASTFGTAAMRAKEQGAAPPAPIETTGAAPSNPPAPPAASSGTLSTEDFVRRAAMSDMFEIWSSRIAKLTYDTPIMNYANHMIDAHKNTSRELAAIAGGRYMVDIPPALDLEHREKLAELRILDSKSLEEKYKQDQIQAHQDAVNLFSTYAQSGSDLELKQWASDMLPHLKHHLEMAQNLK